MALPLFNTDTPVINTVMNPIIEKVNENEMKIGDLSTLTTTEKTNLVGATNELNSAIGQLSNPPININPNFQIWQRGTSLDFAFGTYKYSADRWLCSTSFSSVRIEKDGEFAKLTAVNVGSGSDFSIIQGFETIDVISLRGKKVTFSVNLKKYASMTAGDIVLNVYTGAGIDQVTAVTGRIVTTKKINYSELSENPKLFSLTADVPADTNSMCIIIRVGAIYGNQINNGGSFGVKYAKLELGEIATPLSPRPYGEELALCKRYYQVYKNSRYRVSAITTTAFSYNIDIPEMRVSPTAIFTDVAVATISGNGVTGFTITQSPINNAHLFILATKSSHGLSDGFIQVNDMSLDAEIY